MRTVIQSSRGVYWWRVSGPALRYLPSCPPTTTLLKVLGNHVIESSRRNCVSDLANRSHVPIPSGTALRRSYTKRNLVLGSAEVALCQAAGALGRLLRKEPCIGLRRTFLLGPKEEASSRVLQESCLGLCSSRKLVSGATRRSLSDPAMIPSCLFLQQEPYHLDSEYV